MTPAALGALLQFVRRRQGDRATQQPRTNSDHDASEATGADVADAAFGSVLGQKAGPQTEPKAKLAETA